MPSAAESLAVNGNLAYVCDNNEVSVIDISNLASPVFLGTALSDSIKNDGVAHCSIQRNTLVAFVDAKNTTIGNNPSFVAFNLQNPINPQLIKGTTIQKRFYQQPFYIGNIAFVPTGLVGYFLGSWDNQHGDFVAIDISDFANPRVIDTLMPDGDPVSGGPNYVAGASHVNDQTAYVGGSTSTGANNDGVGRLVVADISNPADMSILKVVQVPATKMLWAP